MRLLRLVAEAIHGALSNAVETLERMHDVHTGTREERVNQIARIDARFAHELSQSGGTPEAPQARHGKRAHDNNLRTLRRAAAPNANPRPRSHAACLPRAPHGSVS